MMKKSNLNISALRDLTIQTEHVRSLADIYVSHVQGPHSHFKPLAYMDIVIFYKREMARINFASKVQPGRKKRYFVTFRSIQS